MTTHYNVGSAGPRHGVGYPRVSGAAQVHGTSLDMQEREIASYFERNGIVVDRMFREEGQSAKTRDRRAMLDALDYCRRNQNRITDFAVYKVDRFARQVEDHFYLRGELAKYGIKLHSVAEPISDSPIGKFTETTLAAFAEFDNAVRAVRCVNGMKERLAQGIYPFKPPVGYICARHRASGEKKRTPDLPDPKLFPMIQRGLRLFLTGACRESELAEKLNVWGFGAERGRPATVNLVDKMLGQYLLFYAGVLVNPWTGEEIPGQHEPMITRQDADVIRAIRSGVVQRPKKERFSSEFPLRGLVRCESCRGLLTASYSRGKRGTRYPYYHCQRSGCSSRTRRDDLHESFTGLLACLTPDPAFLEELFAEADAQWAHEKAALEGRRDHLRRRIAELEHRRERVFELYEGGAYDKAVFQERKQTLESEIAVLRLQSRPTEEDVAEKMDISTTAGKVIELVRNLPNAWRKLPVQRFREIARLAFPEPVLYSRNRGYRTPVLSLIYAEIQGAERRSSPVVDHSTDHWNLFIEEIRQWSLLIPSVFRECDLSCEQL